VWTQPAGGGGGGGGDILSSHLVRCVVVAGWALPDKDSGEDISAGFIFMVSSCLGTVIGGLVGGAMDGVLHAYR
jgi:hypothetical protein